MTVLNRNAPHDSRANLRLGRPLAVHAGLAMAVTNIWLAILIFVLLICHLFFVNWTEAFFAMPLLKSAALFLSCNLGVFAVTFLALFATAKSDTGNGQ